MMGQLMNMAMMMANPLMDMMRDSSKVYMIADRDGDCADPPTEDQMMDCEEAMRVACGNVSLYSGFE